MTAIVAVLVMVAVFAVRGVDGRSHLNGARTPTECLEASGTVQYDEYGRYTACWIDR